MELTEKADDVVILSTPDPFETVGWWHADFPQSEDEEVAQFPASGSGSRNIKTLNGTSYPISF